MATNLCTVKSCYSFGRYCRLHSHAAPKEPKPIAKVAESSKEANKEYNNLAKQYKKEHPKCQAKIKDVCTGKTQDVHHMKGRATKDELLDTKYFLAVCRKCHSVLEQSPAFAKEQGFSVSRHKKTA